MKKILNGDVLLKAVHGEAKKRRAVLLKIADFVLESCRPEHLLKGQLPSSQALRKFNNILIIGIGKAAHGMVKTAVSSLKRKSTAVLYANEGHPFPTQAGIKKTQKIMKAARALTENDLALVFISGGGSAMLVSPAADITLADSIATTESLLKSGAPIQEVNVVRKHISQVKGGRLAALLAPATVLGFVISDVLGNDLSTIASGPLSPDPSTFADALSIIKKYRVKLPRRVTDHLQKGMNDRSLETPKKHDPCFSKVRITILADHETLLKKALAQAKKLGIRTQSLGTEIHGEAREVAKEIVAKKGDDMLFIGTGETTVTCRGKGFGGRNQELVLSGLRFLKPRQLLMSIGTDGVDGTGPEAVAGALADDTTRVEAKKLSLDPLSYLNNNDSYTFFKKVHAHIKTGKTGTNLGDLIMFQS